MLPSAAAVSPLNLQPRVTAAPRCDWTAAVPTLFCSSSAGSIRSVYIRHIPGKEPRFQLLRLSSTALAGRTPTPGFHGGGVLFQSHYLKGFKNPPTSASECGGGKKNQTHQHQVKILTLEGSKGQNEPLSIIRVKDGEREIKNKTKTSGAGQSTHHGGHGAALVGGRHQRAEVRLPAQAGGREALVLQALGHPRGQQPGGAAVVVAAVP